MAGDIKNKKELEDFKKLYPDYKTYDDYIPEVKRGMKYGLMTGIPFGAMAAASDDFDLGAAAGLTGMATAGGALIPSVGHGFSKLTGIDNTKLKDIVKQREKYVNKK
jgi:hypothetical protein